MSPGHPEDAGFFGGEVPGDFDVGAEEQRRLVDLANTRMPFGKYAGRYLVDLPEPYVVWFKKQGWPQGELGEKLAAIHEIKVNGLESLLRPLLRGQAGPSAT